MHMARYIICAHAVLMPWKPSTYLLMQTSLQMRFATLLVNFGLGRVHLSLVFIRGKSLNPTLRRPPLKIQVF
jgi:hypothetical protein